MSNNCIVHRDVNGDIVSVDVKNHRFSDREYTNVAKSFLSERLGVDLNHHPSYTTLEESAFNFLVDKIKNKFGAGVDVVTDKHEFNKIVARSKTVAQFQKKTKFDIDQELSNLELSEQSVQQTKEYYEGLLGDINNAVSNKDKGEEKKLRKRKKAVEYWIKKKGFSMPKSSEHIEKAFELMESKGIDFMKYDSPFALVEDNFVKVDRNPDVNPDDYFENKRTWETEAGDVVIYDVNDVEKLNSFGRQYFGWDNQYDRAKNPWCLCAFTKTGQASESAKNMWGRYSSAQRKIAVLDGKVLAFSANDYNTDKDIWWDLADIESVRLPLGDGQFIDSDGNVVDEDVDTDTVDIMEKFSYNQKEAFDIVSDVIDDSDIRRLYFTQFDKIVQGEEIHHQWLHELVTNHVGATIDDYLDDYYEEATSLTEDTEYKRDIEELKRLSEKFEHRSVVPHFSEMYSKYDDFREHFESTLDYENIYFKHGEDIENYELVGSVVDTFLRTGYDGLETIEADIVDRIYEHPKNGESDILSAAEYEGTNLMSDKEGVIYGAQVGNTIYLNTEHMNANTPIHEFSHLWAKLNPSLFKKGISFFKNTEAGKKTFQEVSENEAYSHLSENERWDEALVSYLGNKGEEIYHQAKDKSKLSDQISKEDKSLFKWVADFFNRLFEAVKGIFSKSDSKPEVNSFSDFTKDLLHQVIGEKRLETEQGKWDEHDPINNGFVSEHPVIQKENIPSETFNELSSVPFVNEKQALDMYKHLYNNDRINNWVNEKLDC